MKKIISSIMLALLALVAVPYASAQFSQSYTAKLTGAEEVPPVTTSTTGFIRVTPNTFASTIGYSLTVNNAVGVTTAHLHCGAKGQNGPVVAFLFGQGSGSQVNGTVHISSNDIRVESSGGTCSPAINNKAELIQALAEGRIYANVHSVANPSGVVRGQLAKMSGFGFNFNTGGNTSTNQLINQFQQQNQQFLQQLRQQQQSLINQFFNR